MARLAMTNFCAGLFQSVSTLRSSPSLPWIAQWCLVWPMFFAVGLSPQFEARQPSNVRQFLEWKTVGYWSGFGHVACLSGMHGQLSLFRGG